MADSERNVSAGDRELGMDRPITRRDFLNGVAVGVGGAFAGAWMPGWAFGEATAPPAAQDVPGYYPPALTGMRGSHPGSFETAHSLRDGTFWDSVGKPVETGENMTWWWWAEV
jgi:spermidine dehydrogenase